VRVILLAALFASTAVLADQAQDDANAAANMPLDLSKLGIVANTGGGPQDAGSNASGTMTTTITPSCPAASSPSSAPVSAWPLGFTVQCAATGSGQYGVQVCLGDTSPAVCGTGNGLAPGGAPTTVTVGSGATATVSIVSCGPASCTMNFSGQRSYAGAPDQLTPQGQVAGAQNTTLNNTVMAGGVIDPFTGKTVMGGSNANTSATLSSYAQNQGQTLNNCFGRQQVQLSGGQAVYTCDNSASVKFNNSGTCTPDQQCVAWTTQTQTYTTTCTATQTYTSHQCDIVTTPQVKVIPGCTQGQTYNSGWNELYKIHLGGGNTGVFIRFTSTCPARGATTIPVHIDVEACYGENTNNCSGSNFNGSESYDVTIPVPPQADYGWNDLRAPLIYTVSGNTCYTSQVTAYSGYGTPGTAGGSVIGGGFPHPNHNPMPIMHAGANCTNGQCSGTWYVAYDYGWDTGGTNGTSPVGGASLIGSNKTCQPTGYTKKPWPLSASATWGIPVRFNFGTPPSYTITGYQTTDGCAAYE
jgi:hypothetical protein